MRVPYALAAVLLVAGCSTPEDPGLEISVPAQAGTIQAAVDAAREGTTILVAPGVYRESVRVGTRGVTIRGAQRGSVIIDGEVRRADGIVLAAPDVSVQNLTVRNHTSHGVLISQVQGFRVSYVTASNNAMDGIHASGAQHGVIEQSYASGSTDSGFHVGRCQACDVVVRGNVAERNAVGYRSADASGRMFVLGNRFSGNRVGLSSDASAQDDVALVGNLVSDNDEALSPAREGSAFGIGLDITARPRAGMFRNLVTGNPGGDVVVGDLPRKKLMAPPGIPFTQVAAPPLQPEMPDAPLPDRAPDVEKYVLPDEDLFDDRAAVRA
ncbi:right-handed parallel beta-helix repeat-containing protein [Lentzea sp. NPDC003310]|uniref:right-handed parallel beta-helix repeat-containing protein n=1 Tax=Lentzea sp. NPDC003310 TaxID=3154447 RepID=UPI0033B1E767